MIWPTTDDVIALHSKIIEKTGGIDGLRDKAGLEAALAAPLQSFVGNDLYPTDLEKFARLGYGLASNHSFIDGNKRIAAMMVQLLIKWNNHALHLKQGELSDLFIAIADGKKREPDLLLWIQKHLLY